MKVDQILNNVLELVKLNGQLYLSNEEATKLHLILPILKSLGWNIFNPKELIPEVTTDSGGRVDYVLYKAGRRVAYIEAKNLSTNVLKDYRALEQLGYYCFIDRIEVGILTNGIQWVVINPFDKQRKLKDRRILLVDLTLLPLEESVKRLSWLSKEKIETLTKLQPELKEELTSLPMSVEVVNKTENVDLINANQPKTNPRRIKTLVVRGIPVDRPNSPTINELIHMDLKGKKPIGVYVNIKGTWYRLEIVGGENWGTPPRLAWSTLVGTVVTFLFQQGIKFEDIRWPLWVDYLENMPKNWTLIQAEKRIGVKMPGDGNSTVKFLKSLRERTGIDVAIALV